MEKAREFQKNIYFCFIDYTKALTVWITTNCGKFLKRQMYQNTLTYLLKNLYAGQESTVRTRQGPMKQSKVLRNCSNYICQTCRQISREKDGH